MTSIGFSKYFAKELIQKVRNNSKENRAAVNVTTKAPSDMTFSIWAGNSGEFALVKDLVTIPLIVGALLFMIGPVPIVISAVS